MQKPNEEKIEQWCNFIVDHLYANDLIAYRDLKKTEKHKFTYHHEKTKQKYWCMQMFSKLDECLFNALYYVNIKKIQDFNNYLNKQYTDEGKNTSNLSHEIRVRALTHLDLANENKYLAKMTNRQYLQWRLKHIKDGYGEHIQEAPISLKATIGLAFSSLIGIYWFFTLKTKPSTKILMGILNLFVVAVLICAIVLNLSIYILIPTAIFYGLFVLASCIHIGCKRYKEIVKYQEEFGNTYDAIITYLNQAEPQKPLEDKINDRKKEQENLSKIKKETRDQINDEHKQT